MLSRLFSLNTPHEGTINDGSSYLGYSKEIPRPTRQISLLMLPEHVLENIASSIQTKSKPDRTFPDQVYYSILDLIALSKTCRDFAHYTRPFIFRTVSLSNGQRAKRLLDLITASPRVASWIYHIHLARSAKPYLEEDIMEWLAIDPGPGALLMLNLCAVQEISLDLKPRVPEMIIDPPSAWVTLSKLKTLRSFHTYSCLLPSLHMGIYLFTMAYPSLRNIRITGLSELGWSSPDIPEQRHECESIRSLSIIDSIGYIGGHLVRVIRCVNLTHLIIGTYEHSFEYAQELINHAPSLERLELCVTRLADWREGSVDLRSNTRLSALIIHDSTPKGWGTDARPALISNILTSIPTWTIMSHLGLEGNLHASYCPLWEAVDGVVACTLHLLQRVSMVLRVITRDQLMISLPDLLPQISKIERVDLQSAQGESPLLLLH